MGCPFLKEGRARYCHAAPVRKLILDGPGTADGGKCASPAYRNCELISPDAAEETRCPHLEEIRVQYCGVSSITKLVPFSDSELSSCTSNSYRYCDSYLSLAHPHPNGPDSELLFAPNHFWLDREEAGLCHLGIDRFLADVAGTIEGVTFATTRGTHCPTVSLTVHGVEWPMSFPNPVMIQRVNSRLRSDPARVTADPYGAGWLFEGYEVPELTRAGLVSGNQAGAWQAEERARLEREIHETHAPGCDGGTPVRGVAQLLPRQHVVCLFQHFFSKRGWTAEE
jgi:glycine cleavage system H lipoate-binding protein